MLPISTTQHGRNRGTKNHTPSSWGSSHQHVTYTPRGQVRTKGPYGETRVPKEEKLNNELQFRASRTAVSAVHMSQRALCKLIAYRRRQRSPRRSCCRSRRRTPSPTGLRTRPLTYSRPECRGTSTATARGSGPAPCQQPPSPRKCGCAMTATRRTSKQPIEAKTTNMK